MSGIVVEEFKAIGSNSLRGFARVRLPSGMVVHDVAIHMGADGPWAGTPSKASIGRDGVQIKRDGKPVFAPVVSFA
jgi:DNA-binding cell septation regulator SpoVG